MKQEILDAIREEFEYATSSFPKYNSTHEGFAILKEEVDELWDAVKLNQKVTVRDELIRKEAIQVATVAIRFLNDLCY